MIKILMGITFEKMSITVQKTKEEYHGLSVKDREHP